MERTIRMCLVAAAVLAGCAERVPAASATAPLYPYWPVAALPARMAVDKAPPPAGGAVLVANGYLLTTTYGMGAVADDFGLDPAVFVYDGTAWHEGRYVDRDKRLHLALIRADVPGTPVRLARAAGRPARLLGLGPLAVNVQRSSPVNAARCREVPRWAVSDFGMAPQQTWCFSEVVHDLAGGIFLDEDGALAGIQTNPFGSTETAGPDAADIRSYLDLYFATWGASVKPKPSY
ncbi:MAG TPA: hypothetical protein VL426_04125 [Candidatus Binatia bacterium]|nr:hypothetical protein [Candidatus Binatia bacterium]